LAAWVVLIAAVIVATARPAQAALCLELRPVAAPPGTVVHGRTGGQAALADSPGVRLPLVLIPAAQADRLPRTVPTAAALQTLPGVVPVGVAAYNTNLTPLVTGPVIELSERHAKIRSSR
jgi:hypothetical protein